MLQQDYLVRIVMQLTEAIKRSWLRAHDERVPKQAAIMLDDAVENALDMEGSLVLSLDSASVVSIMLATDTDPRVSEYIARSLMLSSVYFKEAGEEELSAIRQKQAQAIAQGYGFSLPEKLKEVTPEDVTSQLDLS